MIEFIRRRAHAWLQKQFDEMKPIEYHPGEILQYGHVLMHVCDERCVINGKKGMVLLIRDPLVLLRLLDTKQDYWVPIFTLAAPP